MSLVPMYFCLKNSTIFQFYVANAFHFSPVCTSIHFVQPVQIFNSDKLDNLVTLCDLCHAVIHDHMGPAWVGLSKFPIKEQEQNKLILNHAKEEF